MPITPHFTLSQTDTIVQLDIRVPHVRVSPESVQVVVTERSTLHFSSPPYLLVLDFAPHQFHETAEESCATYEPTIQHGTITLSLKKETKGTWENLDLIGRLVPKKNEETSRWLREIVQDDTQHSINMYSSADDNSVGPGYGFLRMFRGIFTDLARDGLAKEMLEMPWDENNLMHDADKVYETRSQHRWKVEQEKFSQERYLEDLDVSDDYVYQCAMAMQPHWKQRLSVQSLSDRFANLDIHAKNESFFNEEERLQLSSIPYPMLPTHIPQEKETALFSGLVDILFAYVYDHLITDGDPTVESAWTISILSVSLSWLDESTSVDDVVVSSLRRAMVYPYLRNLNFARYVMSQVIDILRQGIRCIIRCLLQVRTILDQSEMFYLGNKLFIDPYLAWLQNNNFKEEVFISLAKEINTNFDDIEMKQRLRIGLEQAEARLDEASEDDTESDSDNSDASSSRSSESNDGESEDKSTEERTHSSELLDASIGMTKLKIISDADQSESKTPETKQSMCLIKESI